MKCSSSRRATRELPGEFTPQGFNAWTNTWLWKYGDVYLTQWKLDSEEIHPEDIPASAFDSPEQKERVTDLLEQYNETHDDGAVARRRICPGSARTKLRASGSHVRQNSAAAVTRAVVHSARRIAAA